MKLFVIKRTDISPMYLATIKLGLDMYSILTFDRESDAVSYRDIVLKNEPGEWAVESASLKSISLRKHRWDYQRIVALEGKEAAGVWLARS
jgi:hypothetical protein